MGCLCFSSSPSGDLQILARGGSRVICVANGCGRSVIRGLPPISWLMVRLLEPRVFRTRLDALRVLGLPIRPAARGRATTASAADFGHVLAVDAHFFAAFPPGGTGFIGREFVGLALLMSSPTAFAGNLPLAMGVHGCESTVFGSRMAFHQVTDSLQYPTHRTSNRHTDIYAESSHLSENDDDRGPKAAPLIRRCQQRHRDALNRALPSDSRGCNRCTIGV